jgi:hypothetical protein
LRRVLNAIESSRAEKLGRLTDTREFDERVLTELTISGTVRGDSSRPFRITLIRDEGATLDFSLYSAIRTFIVIGRPASDYAIPVYRAFIGHEIRYGKRGNDCSQYDTRK